MLHNNGFFFFKSGTFTSKYTLTPLSSQNRVHFALIMKSVRKVIFEHIGLKSSRRMGKKYLPIDLVRKIGLKSICQKKSTYKYFLINTFQNTTSNLYWAFFLNNEVTVHGLVLLIQLTWRVNLLQSLIVNPVLDWKYLLLHSCLEKVEFSTFDYQIQIFKRVLKNPFLLFMLLCICVFCQPSVCVVYHTVKCTTQWSM